MATGRFGARSFVSMCLVICMLAWSVPAFGAVPPVTNVSSSSHPSESTWYSDNSPDFSWDAASDLPTLLGACDTPDYARSVAIAGDVAYVADYTSGLQVIDISDPSNPIVLGSYPTPSFARGVAIAGDVAYVAVGVYGLQLIDISDPSDPTLLGSCETPQLAYGVAIAGDVAYVADYASGLQVIDVSDPSDPKLIGSYDTPSAAYGVAIAGDVAYVADYVSGLQVIDVSDPSDPKLIGSCSTPSYATGVAIAGDVAYVADYASGLQVIDVAVPGVPTLIGSYDTPSYALNVAIAGDVAYVADYASGLLLFDVSDPSAPAILGSCLTPSNAMGVAISGDVAYVADYASGLQLVDISDSSAPTLIGSCDTPDCALGVTTAGDVAYVADSSSGLQVIDISDPGTPMPLGSYDTPGAALGVAISGDVAYVADRSTGLQLIDISKPSAPTLLSSWDTTGLAYGVAISGDIAYVADALSGLQLIDISHPGTPVPLGSCDTPSEALGVAISGDVAYVVDGASGLQVIDISDPSSPTIIGSWNTSGYADGVAIAGDVAYVADGSSGLQVIDISVPSVPTLIGSYDTPSFARGVELAGDVAYLADGASGLQMIDISHPSAPTAIGSCTTPDMAYGIAIAGDVAYLADCASGLQVIRVGTGPVGYSYTLDKDPSTDPDTLNDTAGTSASLSAVDDGTWYFHVRAVAVGHEGGATAHRCVHIETVDPITTSNALATYHDSASITLSATDTDGSGVASTHFILDGGAETTYTAPITVGGIGSHTLEFWSVDVAGNEEVHNTESLDVLDTVDPITTSNALATYHDSASITLSATDTDGSGVASTHFILDGGAETTYTAPITVGGIGSHTLEFWSVDVAGHEEVHNAKAFDIVAGTVTYTPLSGTNRYDTAIKTSRAAFADGEADCVVIATGTNWPDALGGAALAAAKNGPILLTDPTALTSGVLTEIRRLGATEAIIVGSTGAVSRTVETALEEELGGANVDRLGGSNRYATADLIAQAVIAELDAGAGYDGTAFVTTGANFPDALAASPLAAAKGWPIFLSNPAGSPPVSVMRGLGVTDVLILGSTNVVSAGQQATLDAAFPGRVDRLAGADRYATGVAVATYGVDTAGLAWDGLAMSTGANFPDALAGGVLAGRNGSVMLLTGSTSLPTSVRSTLTAQRDSIGNVYYLGGFPAISMSVRDAVAAILH